MNKTHKGSNCNKDEDDRMIIEYYGEKLCTECFKYEIDMGCTSDEYTKFIDNKMMLWNKNIKNKKKNKNKIMTHHNTIITPIRPYESFVNDAKYNLTIKDDIIVFDDNLKNMLNEYYHYTNYQPYFFYLDEHTDNKGKNTCKNPDKCNKCKNFFDKYNINKWDDKDTEYWLKNIFMNDEFYDIYTNI